jgi:bleomycin hydrolase
MFAQILKKDSLVYKNPKSGLYQEIQRETKPLAIVPAKKYMALDLTGKDLPMDTSRYQRAWNNQPVCQGESGTCWCFAATSFLESECQKATGQKIKLSEMFFVYHEYLDRALQYIDSRGAISFDEGSESSSVPLLLKKYGAMPLSAYQGKPAKLKYHHHREMVAEMKGFLNSVKESQNWNPNLVTQTIKSIMERYMQAMPDKFDFNGKPYTAKEFATQIVKLNPDDYYNFMSNMEQTQNQRAELIEDDNWRHFDEYYNVSMADFMKALTNALQNGFTACICGDISEPGFDREQGIGLIPSWDIPSEAITENARQYRLTNKTTTDDHCMHIVGFSWHNGSYWFMTKDSNASAFDAPVKGFRFIHEDYIKLKMMNIMVHKQAARPVLDNIIK